MNILRIAAEEKSSAHGPVSKEKTIASMQFKMKDGTTIEIGTMALAAKGEEAEAEEDVVEEEVVDLVEGVHQDNSLQTM